MNSMLIILILLNGVLTGVLFIALVALSRHIDDISARLVQVENGLFALIDKKSIQPQIKEQTVSGLEEGDTHLNWYGLSQSEIDDIRKVDDSKMLDGVPVLGKGVYNRKHDPVAQLKGVDCASFYD